MEPTSFSEMLKAFGPYGICLFLMGSGLVYLMRWLREDRRATDTAHANIRTEFLAALKDQRVEHRASLKEVTNDFRDAINDHGKRIDQLSAKIDGIDEHVQELRIVRHEAHA